MAKVILGDLVSLTNTQSATALINNNNALIEEAFENTLSRDGTTPNEMSASIDMNSNKVLNLPEPLSNNEPIRKIDLDRYQPTGWFQGPQVLPVTTTTYTVSLLEQGFLLRSRNVAGCTFLLPNDLPENSILIVQRTVGSGEVVFAFETGSTNETPGGASRIVTEGHMVTVFVDSNLDGESASYILQGNVSS